MRYSCRHGVLDHIYIVTIQCRFVIKLLLRFQIVYTVPEQNFSLDKWYESITDWQELFKCEADPSHPAWWGYSFIFPTGDLPLNRVSFLGFRFPDRISFSYSWLNGKVNILHYYSGTSL